MIQRLEHQLGNDVPLIAGEHILGSGVVALEGAAALEFLNRMATNDLMQMRDGEAITTILTTEKGRIVDLVRVIKSHDRLLLATSRDTQAHVKQWLERYIIMEDIRISDVTNQFVVRNLFAAPGASHAPTDANGSVLNSTSARPVSTDGGVMIIQDELWPSEVYLSLEPGPGAMNEQRQALPGVTQQANLPDDLFELRRVREGVPVYGRELSERFNPLEVNLGRFISYTKGCYVGQEVIARIDSYKKLQRKIAGFYLDVPPGETARPGPLLVKMTEAGEITSVAPTGNSERRCALGFLNTNYAGGPLQLHNVAENRFYPVSTSHFPLLDA